MSQYSEHWTEADVDVDVPQSALSIALTGLAGLALRARGSIARRRPPGHRAFRRALRKALGTEAPTLSRATIEMLREILVRWLAQVILSSEDAGPPSRPERVLLSASPNSPNSRPAANAVGLAA